MPREKTDEIFIHHIHSVMYDRNTVPLILKMTNQGAIAFSLFKFQVGKFE